MKQTSDKAFLDTNIIVYAHTDIETIKQKKAQAIISEKITILSTQVLQETIHTLIKKFKHPWPDVLKVLADAVSNNIVHTNTNQTILEACNVAKKYNYSFYDSLIIAAALECSCNILYSEDLHNGQLIENKLRIINPFE